MPSRAASTSSVAEPVHWIGRVCGVSPSSAPSVTIDLATRSCARRRSRRRRTCASAGSVRRRAAARGRARPRDGEPAESASDGHVTVRTTPSTSSTVGRDAWKSTYSSMSSAANGRALLARASQRTASDAASAASFQPENAAISAGRRNVGSRSSGRSRAHLTSRSRAVLRLSRTTGLRSVPTPSIGDLDDVAVDEPAGRRARRADTAPACRSGSRRPVRACSPG